jgi:hypothetical protein
MQTCKNNFEIWVALFFLFIAFVFNKAAESSPGNGNRCNDSLKMLPPDIIPDLGWKLTSFIPGSGELSSGIASSVLLGVVLVLSIILMLIYVPKKKYSSIILGFSLLWFMRTIGALVTYNPPVFPLEKAHESWLKLRPNCRFGIQPSGHTITFVYCILIIAFYLLGRCPGVSIVLVAIVLPICLLSVVWSHIHRTETVYLTGLITGLLALYAVQHKIGYCSAMVFMTIALLVGLSNVLVF